MIYTFETDMLIHSICSHSNRAVLKISKPARELKVEDALLYLDQVKSDGGNYKRRIISTCAVATLFGKRIPHLFLMLSRDCEISALWSRIISNWSQLYDDG